MNYKLNACVLIDNSDETQGAAFSDALKIKEVTVSIFIAR